MANDGDEVRITLRLPVSLRDRLISASNQNARSMNGEIVHRLDDYDRLTSALAETGRLLEQREEQLYNDRVLLRKLIDQRSDAPSKEALLEANARAEKYHSLVNQARTRLGIVREERDRLAQYVKAISEGIEKDHERIYQISALDDRTLLLKIYYETMRLSSELVLQRNVLGDYAHDQSPDEDEEAG